MIEVDVFWSFALGSAFGAFAGRDLAIQKYWDVNKYFMYCLIYMAIFFAPSGLYLLWAFPGWESMYLFSSHGDIHPVLASLFFASNILLAALGFYLASLMVRSGDLMKVHSLWVTAYVVMFGILGFGYRRFFYSEVSGPADKFSELGGSYRIEDFFQSKIFTTLAVMTIILPFHFRPLLKWFWANGNTFEDQLAVWRQVVESWLSGVTVGVVGYLLTVFVFTGEEHSSIFRDDNALPQAEKFAPLVGFLCAEVTFLTLISALLLIVRPSRAH